MRGVIVMVRGSLTYLVVDQVLVADVVSLACRDAKTHVAAGGRVTLGSTLGPRDRNAVG